MLAETEGAGRPEDGGNPEATLPQDIRNVQTIKHDAVFLLSDRYGDIYESESALGLYFRDTRFLSEWQLHVDGRRPLFLHSEADRNYSMLVETTLPVEEIDHAGKHVVGNLQISRHRWLESGMREVIRFTNFGLSSRAIQIDLTFAADFLDLFEVRGLVPNARGVLLEPVIDEASVRLGYEGRDSVRRTTTIRLSPRPDEVTPHSARWKVALLPRGQFEITASARPKAGGWTPPQLSHQELDREYVAWRKRCTKFRVSNDQLQQYLDRSVLDLRMMQTADENGAPVLDAGVPWFSTLFGRDALITAYQTLGVNPDLARAALERLAALQGTEVNDWRDEEPGKILHEVRVGELASMGAIPHTPYYGSVDSTPLWLVVYGYAWNWTGDREFAERLWPNALRALEWIDKYGDADGDGYVEYEKRSPNGLDSQGWKDSFDGILHDDGSIPKAPIALCEVQGYVYDAKRRVAEVARALGHHSVAADLLHQAEVLRRKFNEDFWMNDAGTYAVALDGDKRQVRSITSNPGHCLWSEIVDEHKAPRVARRLMAPDLISGWGIRTLSTRNPRFDPIGYHRGTVWPHDNSIIAHGLQRYGFHEESNRVIDEIASAGGHFSSGRYPELFCGYARNDVPVPVEYPVACRPQAWATGTPLLMIRSYGGITADAPNKTLSIVRPNLPRWLERAELIGMRVGDARVDLAFQQSGGATAVQVLRRDGELDVVVRY